jgi:hypothetical protein
MSITREMRRAPRRPGLEVFWEMAMALAFGLAIVGFLATFVSFRSDDEPAAGPNYASSLWSAEAGTSGIALSSDTISVTVTATGGLRTIIGAPQVLVSLPKDATVAQLSNRLVDDYPALGVPMIHDTGFMGKMFPQNTVLKDGQVVTLGR